MVALYTKYKDKGFNAMAFPCNQFGEQESGTEQEIKDFVSRYKVTFPMFSKIEVNGKGTHPVYTFLKTCFPGDVTWNFASKFLVDRNGVPVKRFEKESWSDIEKEVVALLAEKPDSASSSSSASTSSSASEEKKQPLSKQ